MNATNGLKPANRLKVFESYLEKNAVYSSLISESPEPGLNLIVVIPCHNEPDLLRSLDSLSACSETRMPVEIIVVINQSENPSIEIVNNNNASFSRSLEWAMIHNRKDRKYRIIKSYGLREKDAGVGLARKIGMDEAVRRFVQAGNPDGVIAGFDADCICSENYLNELEKRFIDNKINAASVYFEHPLGGIEFEADVYRAVWQYELHLRYYRNALSWTGFPFAYHTVGSSFAVRADVYCKQGGMNKKKAGEDFYFLSKVIPLGNYSEINNATVYPSPRASDRVPFGTGAAIGKMLINSHNAYNTYRFDLFSELRQFFSDTEKIFRDRKYIYPENILGEYCNSVLFDDELKEIIDNTSSLKSFRNRFYTVFNAFRILKFLNYAAEKGYQMSPVEIESKKLLEKLNVKSENKDLLQTFRDIDRGLNL